MSGTFDLERFVGAQEPVLGQVYQELRDGRKQTHWMWFIFPQLAGLGRSSMAEYYAISSLAEARAYLDHPLLGSRLIELTGLANRVTGRSVREIFGSPDDMKFRSSMTLFATVGFATVGFATDGFAKAGPEASVFRDALDKYFAGQADPLTTDKLRPG